MSNNDETTDILITYANGMSSRSLEIEANFDSILEGITKAKRAKIFFRLYNFAINPEQIVTVKVMETKKGDKQ